MNGYLPSKIVKIMCEALDLIKKIQEDIQDMALEFLERLFIQMSVEEIKEKPNLIYFYIFLQ